MILKRKKGMILLVAVLFITMSFSPVITAEKQKTTQPYAVNLTSIAENGQLIKDTMYLSEQEVQSLRTRLSWIINLLNNQKNSDGVYDLLSQFLNINDYPVLSFIVANILESQNLLKGKLIFSEGWSLTLNPFKTGDFSFIKPITFWKYQDGSDMFQIPSMTTIVDLNPFELKTIEGSQLGFMFRFKGIYLEIVQPLPQQSFTFFVGISKHATALEMPTISLPGSNN